MKELIDELILNHRDDLVVFYEEALVSAANQYLPDFLFENCDIASLIPDKDVYLHISINNLLHSSISVYGCEINTVFNSPKYQILAKWYRNISHLCNHIRNIFTSKMINYKMQMLLQHE